MAHPWKHSWPGWMGQGVLAVVVGLESGDLQLSNQTILGGCEAEPVSVRQTPGNEDNVGSGWKAGGMRWAGSRQI